MNIVSLLLAIFKAFPIIEKWFDEAKNRRIDEMKKENREAIEISKKTDDQRPIEDAINSSKTGELSGVPNTEIVSSIPGVKP